MTGARGVQRYPLIEEDYPALFDALLRERGYELKWAVKKALGEHMTAWVEAHLLPDAQPIYVPTEDQTREVCDECGGLIQGWTRKEDSPCNCWRGDE